MYRIPILRSMLEKRLIQSKKKKEEKIQLSEKLRSDCLKSRRAVVCCWWSSQLDSALHLRSQPWKAAPAWYLLDASRQIKNYLLCLFVWNPVAGVEIFLVPHWVTLAFLGHLSIVCTASIKYSPWKFHAIFSWSLAFALYSSADWNQLKSLAAPVILTCGSERCWECFCWWGCGVFMVTLSVVNLLLAKEARPRKLKSAEWMKLLHLSFLKFGTTSVYMYNKCS